MASHDPRSASGGTGQSQRGGGANGSVPGGRHAAVAEAELALADLIGDERGEVVLFNDSHFRTLALKAEVGVVARGLAARHVTAGGDNVTGFRFVSFANGVTLYYREGLDLIVRGPGGAHAP